MNPLRTILRSFSRDARFRNWFFADRRREIVDAHPVAVFLPAQGPIDDGNVKPLAPRGQAIGKIGQVLLVNLGRNAERRVAEKIGHVLAFASGVFDHG